MPNPIGTRPASGPTPSTSASHTVTVAAGDSLSKIAARSGVSTQALIDANKAKYPTLATNPNAIQVGWKLSLPGGSAAPTPTTPAPAPAAWAPRSNNDVVLVGMNASSTHELESLKQRGLSVTYVKDGAVEDFITTGTGSSKTTHDLKTKEGATAFALTLGLPAEQTAKVAEVIRGAGEDARDEMAQVAQIWSRAEKGGQIPSRLVLSGHSVGDGTWGDGNGTLSFDQLGRLAEAMPKAARSVEDLHLAACYSGGQSLMQKYQGIFPNAKTIWAYRGSAPGSVSGATAHLSRWDTATRGSQETLSLALAANTRKGENVAVWSKDAGYLNGKPPSPLADARSEVTSGEATFSDFQSGSQKVFDTQSGPLRDYYNSVQSLLQHPELPDAERPQLEMRRDQTIRLIYFCKTVAPKFAEHHASAIRDGFTAVGLPVPDFKTLSRGEAMAQVKAFEDKLATMSPKQPAAERLLPLLTEGLRDLKASRIPDGWV